MFTHKEFIRILNVARHNNYRFILFSEAKKHKAKTCLLRHDVDNSPEAALKMAKLECKLGIKATYFFMVTSEVYNISSPRTQQIVREIRSFGQEIGLHFSEKTYARLNKFKKAQANPLLDYIEQEAAVVEKITGKSVRAVSFHQPSRELLSQSLALKGRINVYRPQDTGNAYYLSDSNMQWRGPAPLKLFSTHSYDKIQLLIHPLWWRKSPGSLRQRWLQAMGDRVSAIWQSWQVNECTLDRKWPRPKLK